jgi:hypothetical protein
MTPQELINAATEIKSRLDDTAIIHVSGGWMVVDWDNVWPECTEPDAICEGSGEYRRVAHIMPFDGEVVWNEKPSAGEGHND